MNSGKMVISTAKVLNTLNNGQVEGDLLQFELLELINWIKSYSKSKMISLSDFCLVNFSALEIDIGMIFRTDTSGT